MAELLADFLSRDTEPRPHIIGRGVLPVKGKLILYGDPKTNKSFIGINVGLSLAAGQPVFGALYKSGTPVLPVTRPYRVLYIEQEIGEDGLRERLRHIGAPVNGVPLYLKTRDTELRLDLGKGRDALIAELEQVKPEVLILDPLAKFHLSDENSAQQMGAVLRVVDHWIEALDISVILIHHTSKPSEFRHGAQRMRGTSALFGDADALVGVERLSPAHHKEPVVKLEFELRRGEPFPPLHLKRLTSGLVEYLGEDYRWGRPTKLPEGLKEPYPDL